MYPKVLFFIVSLAMASSLNAQSIRVEGHVLDAITKEPIPYVNLSFLNTLKGTSTDEAGHFFIDISEVLLEKDVHISSLGYEEKVLKGKILSETKNIYLEEESFELDEVVLSEIWGDSEVLNPISSYSLTSGFSSSSTPWVLALYFPNLGAKQKVIEKVMVFFQQQSGKLKSESKFRLRVYDIDMDTGAPGEDVLRENVILNTQEGDTHVSVDLSEYKIIVPRDGVYIGLEWLFIPYNWYRSTTEDPITKQKYVEDRFAPTFGGVYSGNFNYKTMIYGMGTWSPFRVVSRGNDKSFIPAISLKYLIQ
ncbi:MAG: carboxypeptidase-like regulatory domain-containing protein [Bacteroidia bacterium]|nr:carboxypeptidase-like regulatory domain-containing protein [Bacteroidia bacterium]